MIEKLYVCDLCGNPSSPKPSSSKRPAQRLYWTTGPAPIIELRPLIDHTASEKIICGTCLNMLQQALARA